MFVERLRSESTRLATIKALTAVSTSPHALDISCILYDVVAELHVLLRQHSRELRQATLVLLTSLVRARDTPLSTEQLAPVLVELSSMINDDDLQMCSLCLSLCTAVASTGRAGGVLVCSCVGTVWRYVVWPCACVRAHAVVDTASSRSTSCVLWSLWPPALSCRATRCRRCWSSCEASRLSTPRVQSSNPCSPRCSRLCRACVRDVLRSHAASGCARGGVGSRAHSVPARFCCWRCCHGCAADRHAKANVARCIAAIITSASESEKAALLRRLLVASNDASGEPRFLQLRCVGEIGRVVDINAVEPAAFETLYKELGSDGDAVKSAAAYAIGLSPAPPVGAGGDATRSPCCASLCCCSCAGCACVGCMEPGLHKLLERLASDTKHAYSLLSALKVVVSEFAASPSKFGGYVAPVVPVLEGQCESKEEGVRSMAAECLGALRGVLSCTHCGCSLARPRSLERDAQLRRLRQACRRGLGHDGASVPGPPVVLVALRTVDGRLRCQARCGVQGSEERARTGTCSPAVTPGLRCRPRRCCC